MSITNPAVVEPPRAFQKKDFMKSPGPEPTAPPVADEVLQLQRLLAVESVRADFGELARPLIHELNNFLNNIVLSIAVIEQAGGDMAPELTRLRRQSERVTRLIREFHEYRSRKAPPAEPVNLNDALLRAIELVEIEEPLLAGESSPLELPLNLQLAPDLRLVTGMPADFVRLCMFLLRNVVRAVHAVGGHARLETASSPERVALRIDLDRVALPPELSARTLESLNGTIRGFSSLELAACTAIARRFRGILRAESVGGNLRIVLEFPALA